MTQPGLSAHIAALEKEYGTQFVERGPKMALTPAGHAFLLGCQATVAEYDKIPSLIAQALPKPAPVRVYNFHEGPVAANIYAAMGATPCEFVDLEFSGSIMAELEKDTVEIAILSSAPGDEGFYSTLAAQGYTAIPIGLEPVGLCVSSGDPLFKSMSDGSIPREALRGRDMVINAAMFFDSWRDVLLQVLGEDLGLTFHLDPVRNRSNLRFVDLSGSIHACNLSMCRALAASRPDVSVVDRIDGRQMMSVWNLVCKSDNPRVAPICENARTCAADGLWA